MKKHLQLKHSSLLLFVVSIFFSIQGCTPARAALPVVVSEKASVETKAHAATLAEYLGKISGAKFEVQTGDGKSGFAVGVVGDFPALKLNKEFAPEVATRREEYLLRSHDNGVLLIGATDLAVSHAVWDYLYRLGYRQFFPGKHWEVVPSTPDVKIKVDIKTSPDFYGRRIWYGFGDWRDNTADKKEWDSKNRMAEGLKVSGGHAWDGIYSANKAEFDAHPEYLMSKRPVKFCVSNPGLRQLVVDWALKKFDANPNLDSISLDPSDGGGWDNPDGSCPDATVYKSVSDRVVTLANEVVEAINKKYPDKYVAIYAYSKHSPPPSIKVNPHVAVGVATAFSAGFDNIAPGWQKQGAVIGVREYYDVTLSSKGMPGAGPNFLTIADKIRDQYEKGAHFMSAESSDNWGPTGLSYYLAARTLWNVHDDSEAIINDFFDKAFGPAQQPMRDFYDQVRRGSPFPLSADKIGRMYGNIAAAQKLTDDPAILKRLNDLALYTRYVEMMHVLNSKEDTEEVLAFTYRMRDRHMVHNYALWRDSRNWRYKTTGDKSWQTPEGKNPLKSSQPFTQEEINTIIKNGIAANPLINFKPVAFSKELVPATALKLSTAQTGGYGFDRPSHHFYVWVDKAPATLELSVTGGQVSVGGQTTLKLSSKDDPASATLATAEVPNDKQPHDVSLKTTFAGLHRLDISTQRHGAHVSWPDGMPVVAPSSLEEPVALAHRINMYFYVPKGTKVVAGFASGVGSMVDGDGKKVLTFTKADFGKGNYFSVPVAAGQDGKLWEFVSSAGPRLLMTVPPYLARSADEMMLPKEVIEADKP